MTAISRKIREHLLAIGIVGLAFLILYFQFLRQESRPVKQLDPAIETIVSEHILDPVQSSDAVLLRETLHRFFPGQPEKVDSLLHQFSGSKEELALSEKYKSGRPERGVTARRLLSIAAMFIPFIALFIIVNMLVFYLSQTAGTLRFIHHKQREEKQRISLGAMLRSARVQTGKHRWKTIKNISTRIVSLCAAAILSIVLFSPAYVAAYAMKTKINTDSFFFLVLLAVLTNGLLATYAYKFYALLVAESRKGYVETAVAQGLHSVYLINVATGIQRKNILSWNKKFPLHILRHIMDNARYKSIPMLKEQSSMLMTGIMIIEMALNIQGFLSYELLQSVLYEEYDVTLTIIFGLFVMIKCVEAAVDAHWLRKSAQYENSESRKKSNGELNTLSNEAHR